MSQFSVELDRMVSDLLDRLLRTYIEFSVLPNVQSTEEVREIQLVLKELMEELQEFRHRLVQFNPGRQSRLRNDEVIRSFNPTLITRN